MKRPELVLFPPIAATLAAVTALSFGASFWLVALIFFLTGPVVILLRLLTALMPNGASAGSFDREQLHREQRRK